DPGGRCGQGAGAPPDGDRARYCPPSPGGSANTGNRAVPRAPAVDPSARVRLCQVRAGDPQPAQARLHFRNAHEQLPQQAGAMVLDHDDDRALVDGDVGVGIPVTLLAKGIDEPEPSPELLAVLIEDGP